MKIITNNHVRPLIYGYELTEEERREFDYIDSEEFESHGFFRYRGVIYDTGEFMVVAKPMCLHWPEFEQWQGYQSDSFFSGILIRYCDNFESVVVATYIN